DAIAPALKRGQTVLIAAHGNSLRALVKYLEGISEDQITSLNIPTGIPLHYRLDEDLRVIERRYLGDASEAEAAAAAVANQARSGAG
ncbi:MAG: 2,3-bisphosphoglycerate-dependent phosphoglycerate mutase, partial [Salinisphaera sp.]|nr:2,3-bisphosphoglycerate-dependent phosphoglycerate mutase [Salinisphaera sp.]